MKNKDFYCFFSTSQVVYGEDFIAIYRLDNNAIERLPIELKDFVRHLQASERLSSIRERYGDAFVSQWLTYFQKHDLGFYTNDPAPFLDITKSYEVPSTIRRAVIEYDSNEMYDIKVVIEALESLHCKHIELRLRGSLSIAYISSILELFSTSCIRSIVLYIENLVDQIEDTSLADFPKVYHSYVFNAKEQVCLPHITKLNACFEMALEQPYNLNRLVINTQFFIEALRYNPFYNSKLSVSRVGAIKNDLDLKEEYGRVKSSDDIQSIAQSKYFQRFWKVNVDKIENLKHLDYRYAIYPAREIVSDGALFYLDL